MAQVPRTTASTAGLSDDPIENATDWFNQNRKIITIAVSVLAAVALLIFLYRSMDESKREKASTALEQAQGIMSTGNPAGAEAALERVVKSHSGTSAAQQAALMLAQVRFDNGKRAEGIRGLEAALGGASDEFKPSIEQMIAMGYEADGKHREAATHYGSAAGLAKFDADKAQYQASQARQLMAAGMMAEAKTIWEALERREDLPVYQEARVRLGEIAGAAK